jgi:S-adenosylmethionine:tRNA ribosyltransferase-isomerase
LFVKDFDYLLPQERIADKPHYARGKSKLLVLDKTSGSTVDDFYASLPDYLEPGDVLVLNRTKVFKARLRTKTAGGREREIIILEKHGIKDDWHQHKIMYRGKLMVGDKLYVGTAELSVKKILDGGLAIIESKVDLLTIAEEYGEVPLPPYMKRRPINSDTVRYQTIWANDIGSVAAPTASLNMSENILSEIKAKGVLVAYITLHVGLGTFMPIRTDNVEEHIMHKECFEIPVESAQAISKARLNGHRVVAVGTTVCRTLEYNSAKLKSNVKHNLLGEADIFIFPGYEFKIVDMLLTNFHAPKSTVLMMASAFAGWDNLKRAYDYAESHDYWFLSYGDSMLIK